MTILVGVRYKGMYALARNKGCSVWDDHGFVGFSGDLDSVIHKLDNWCEGTYIACCGENGLIEPFLEEIRHWELEPSLPYSSQIRSRYPDWLQKQPANYLSGKDGPRHAWDHRAPD